MSMDRCVRCGASTEDKKTIRQLQEQVERLKKEVGLFRHGMRNQNADGTYTEPMLVWNENHDHPIDVLKCLRRLEEAAKETDEKVQWDA